MSNATLLLLAGFVIGAVTTLPPQSSARVSGAGPSAAAPVEMDERSHAILGAYGANPRRHRRALVAAVRGDVDRLPSAVVLAIADARMRGGSFRRAGELCEVVLRRPREEPWTSWARLGKAWAAFGAGDHEASIHELRALAESDDSSNVLAAFVLGLLDATRGDLAEAHAHFRRVATAASDEGLRAAAKLGAGLARYWMGEYDQAAAELGELVAQPLDGPFADDSRYALALVDLARGRRADAVQTLEELAELPRRGLQRTSAALLLDLEPAVLLRVGFERYRRSASTNPQAQIAQALDSDGGALARAALRRLDAPIDPRLPSPATTEVLATTARARPVASTAKPGEPPRPPLRRTLAIGVIVLVAFVFWLGHRALRG